MPQDQPTSSWRQIPGSTGCRKAEVTAQPGTTTRRETMRTGPTYRRKYASPIDGISRVEATEHCTRHLCIATLYFAALQGDASQLQAGLYRNAARVAELCLISKQKPCKATDAGAENLDQWTASQLSSDAEKTAPFSRGLPQNSK